MNHRLKIWPAYYRRVADGTKTFEVRNNDRAFQFGDTVTLCEYDPEPVNATSKAVKGFTKSPELEFKIGYVHVLNSHEVIFSLLPIEPGYTGNVFQKIRTPTVPGTFVKNEPPKAKTRKKS